MNWLPALVAVLIGAGLTIQIGLNAAVRGALGSPLLAAVVNFVVGLLVLLLVALASGVRWPSGAHLASVPGWAWLGGLIGASYIAASTVLGPRLGAAALLVDHYGVLGFPQNSATPLRLLGAALLVVGVLLLMRR